MTIRNLIICASFLLMAGCAGNRKAEQFRALPFPDVRPPAMMENQQDRADYMVRHWWDAITEPSRDYPCDTAFVSGVSREEVEQKFANWTNMLGIVAPSTVRKSLERLYERASACESKDTSSNVFETFTDLVVKYLYDPNSPFRNEDYYAYYASCLASSDLMDDLMREKY